jgi:hypothetical protein
MGSALSSPVRPRAERIEGGSVGDAGGFDVFVEIGFELVVGRHLMALAAFFVETDPPALAVGEIVLALHGDGADAGEGIRHDRNEGAIAQPDQGRGVDAIEQQRGLVGRQHRRVAPLEDMLGAAHRVGRVDGEDPAGDEPVEQLADGSEVAA